MAYKESRQLRILNFALYDQHFGILNCLLGIFLLIRSSLDPMFCSIFFCGPLQRMFIKKRIDCGFYTTAYRKAADELALFNRLFNHLTF